MIVPSVTLPGSLSPLAHPSFHDVLLARRAISLSPFLFPFPPVSPSMYLSRSLPLPRRSPHFGFPRLALEFDLSLSMRFPRSRRCKRPRARAQSGSIHRFAREGLPRRARLGALFCMRARVARLLRFDSTSRRTDAFPCSKLARSSAISMLLHGFTLSGRERASERASSRRSLH